MNLVSTIIPVFNRPAMIREAVASVLTQTHRPIEIILVDDGSTDDTPAVLASLAVSHPEVIVLKQDNAGPGAARNTGFKVSKGDFIQYLDSDDVLHPRKFEQQINALNSMSDAGVCYCVTLRRDAATGQMVPWARTADQIDDIFPSFLPKRGWATLTPLWRRTVCEAIGPWKPYRVMEDWEHDLRAGLLGVKPIQVAEVLCTVRDHSQERASGMNEGFTSDRIRYYFLAHESIWTLMQEMKAFEQSYLQTFSRTMFWIARMCGEHGLRDEAERALLYTDQITDSLGQKNITRRFRLMKRLIGWRAAAGSVEFLVRLRRVFARA